ncbi:MAG: hypothetical protein HY908_18065 [Myxococcales bacterium]|nr:hypothetical protein [Myxococcales bacterium]
MANDCEGGDIKSCTLACLGRTVAATRPAACEKSCQSGVATSCGVLGMMLAEQPSGATPKALEYLARGCDGGDGNVCVGQAKFTPGLSGDQKLALFIKGCERGGPTACLLAGVNELAADKTVAAREHFEKGSKADRDRILANAYWTSDDREAGTAVGQFSSCVSTEAIPAARRQSFCLEGEAYLAREPNSNRDLDWAKLYEGSVLAHVPAARGGEEGTFDTSIIPAARGWYCFALTAGGIEIVGLGYGYEACYLTQADCARELSALQFDTKSKVVGDRLQVGIGTRNLHPADDKAACEQTRSEAPNAFCSSYVTETSRGYTCHEERANCEKALKRSSACVPLTK